MRIRLVVIVGVLAASTAVKLTAQVADDRDDGRPPRWAVGLYVGVARHSLVGTHLGVTPDRNHLFLGVHTMVNFVRSRRWTLGYAPEVVPLLLISNNPKYRQVPEADGSHVTVEDGRGPVAGSRFLRSALKSRFGLPLAGVGTAMGPRAASGLLEKCPPRTRAHSTTPLRWAEASYGNTVFESPCVSAISFITSRTPILHQAIRGSTGRCFCLDSSVRSAPVPSYS